MARALRAVARAALQASKEYQEALLGGAQNGVGSDGGVGRWVNTIAGAEKMRGGECDGGGGGPLPTFQRWGPVGVLSISTTASQIDRALGRRESGRELLSKGAWAWLEAFFRAPEIGFQVRGDFSAVAGSALLAPDVLCTSKRSSPCP